MTRTRATLSESASMATRLDLSNFRWISMQKRRVKIDISNQKFSAHQFSISDVDIRVVASISWTCKSLNIPQFFNIHFLISVTQRTLKENCRCGFANMTNFLQYACYMNSALQVLFSCTLFVQKLQIAYEDHNCDGKSRDVFIRNNFYP